MTTPEIELAQANQRLVPCCKMKPGVAYTPGVMSLRCERCGRSDALADWQPLALARRWNAAVLGPVEFARLFQR